MDSSLPLVFYLCSCYFQRSAFILRQFLFNVTSVAVYADVWVKLVNEKKFNFDINVLHNVALFGNEFHLSSIEG